MVCAADLTYTGLAQRKSNGFLIRGSGVRISHPVPQGQHGKCSKRLATKGDQMTVLPVRRLEVNMRH